MASKKKQLRQTNRTRFLLLLILFLGIAAAAVGMMMSPKETVTTKASEDNKCHKEAKACLYKCSLLPGGSQDPTKVNCQKTCITSYATCRQGQTQVNRFRGNRPEFTCIQKCDMKKAGCKAQCEICAGPEGKGCSLCPIRDEDKCNQVCKTDYSACASGCSSSSSSSSIPGPSISPTP